MTPPVLRAAGLTLPLGERPLLMGIVNATPDSFSDAGDAPTPGARLELARTLLRSGADLLDVGGESARGDRPAVSAQEETERVVPIVEELAGEGALISVDTYKPAVAAAAVAAGAAIVNDASGLHDEAIAEVCASTGAALVIMHTRVAPKGTLLDPGRYEDVVADVVAFLEARMEVAIALGVAEEQIVLDPGPDFAKTPAQTVEVLSRLGELRALGRPVLLAASRKDFLGALCERPPADRLAGTLAAIGEGVDAGAAIVRVHDVAATRDFLTVRAALRGEVDVPHELRLDPRLRRQAGSPA